MEWIGNCEILLKWGEKCGLPIFSAKLYGSNSIWYSLEGRTRKMYYWISPAIELTSISIISPVHGSVSLHWLAWYTRKQATNPFFMSKKFPKWLNIFVYIPRFSQSIPLSFRLCICEMSNQSKFSEKKHTTHSSCLVLFWQNDLLIDDCSCFNLLSSCVNTA